MSVTDRPRRFARELEVATRLALAAGEVVRRHAAGHVEERHKSSGEVVSAADLECDALIRAGLAEAFPDDAILSEETGDSAARLGLQRVWVVDPIDGTSDFIAGGDEHAVSIGLAVDGRAALGVVHNPKRRELYAGAEGHGVDKDGAPARVSGANDLEVARLVVSRKEWKRGFEPLAAALPIRPMGSIAYKLARVAAGLDDGTFYLKPRKEWDVCAGVALVLAGGGCVGLLHGGEPRFNAPDVKLPDGFIACAPGLFAALAARLAPYAAPGS
ncbi:MAG: 3'(2'),5'-bisphosphate nucleotidase CysQ [Anaeromyxobacteraceae bacterium]